MDEITADLVREARTATGDSRDGAVLYRELTGRNTRGPAMHRIDRLAVSTTFGVVPVLVYVPLPVPAGVILLLDRAPHEGGNTWATESLARRVAERTSCEVVTADLYSLGLEDQAATIEAAASAVRWSVSDRQATDPSSTASFVVLGHGAGGLTATQLMSAHRYDDVGRHVSDWVLVSPSLTSRTTPSDSAPMGEDDRIIAEMAASLVDHSQASDVASLARDAAAQTSAVSAHCGGALDPTSAATAELVRILCDQGIHATAHEYPEQINGFFSIMSIPTGERTLQSVIRTVRASVIAAQEGRC